MKHMRLPMVAPVRPRMVSTVRKKQKEAMIPIGTLKMFYFFVMLVHFNGFLNLFT